MWVILLSPASNLLGYLRSDSCVHKLSYVWLFLGPVYQVRYGTKSPMAMKIESGGRFDTDRLEVLSNSLHSGIMVVKPFTRNSGVSGLVTTR